MHILWQLYTAFFRVGLFTFGGGYAMLPLLEREVVQRHGWATREDLLDYFAIGQATPGIIAVNTATMVGYNRAKVRGAAAATLGMVTPSLVIICLIAAVLQNFAHLPVVAHAFAGIRVAVCALIAAAVIKLFRSNVLPPKDQPKAAAGMALFLQLWLPLLLCAAAFVLVGLLGVSPGFVVVGAALLGLVFYRQGGGK